jgi:hypothetical protein
MVVLGNDTKISVSVPGFEEPSDQFGELLVKRGQVRRYQLEFALKLQSAYRKIQKNIPIGEILVQHRAISNKTREDTASLQKSLPLEKNTEIMKGLDLDESTFVTQLISMKPVSGSSKSLAQ